MMSLTVSFKAKGHQNVRSKHTTTFMTTKEPELSLQGDCIIVVSAEMSLKDLPQEAKDLARHSETSITFLLEVGEHTFEATGHGHPALDYTDPIDMVARRSSYTCGRTLMINCDKTSQGIPDDVVRALQDPEAVAEITLTYTKNPVSP
jgi:hypothetical protein